MTFSVLRNRISLTLLSGSGAVLLCFTSCLKVSGGGNHADEPNSGSETAENQPVPIAGTNFVKKLNFQNARVQCGFEALAGSGQHLIECNVNMLDTNGLLVKPEAIEKGISLRWDLPKRIEGAEIQSQNCQTREEGLQQICDITLEDSSVTKLSITLNLKDEIQFTERQEEAVLLIPFSVSSFGIVPEIPFLVRNNSKIESRESADSNTPVSLQNSFASIKLDPKKTFFPEPLSACERKPGEIFFSSRNFVYRIYAGSAELFAGTVSNLKDKSLLHRRRINMGPSLMLACASDAVFVADTRNARIYRIPDQGAVTIVAGTGIHGFSGDGESAANAQLHSPTAMIIGPNQSLIFADSGNRRVRQISATGIITTIAGNGDFGSSGDGGSALQASFGVITGLTLTLDQFLVIADAHFGRVRKIDSKGIISTIPTQGQPYSITYVNNLTQSGLLFAADVYSRRLLGFFANGVPDRILNANSAPFATKGNLAAQYPIMPLNLFRDSRNGLILCDLQNHIIVRYSKPYSHEPGEIIAGMPALPSGNLSVSDVNAGQMRLRSEGSIALAKDGTLYVSDSVGHRIIKIDSQNRISNFAGLGRLKFDPYTLGDKWWKGYSPDGTPVDSAFLDTPTALAIDGEGDVIVSERGNFLLRRVQTDGTLTTIAGNKNLWYDGTNGKLAKETAVGDISALAVAADGTIYYSDIQANMIRRIAPDGRIYNVAGDAKANAVRTFFGTHFPTGYSGDNGSAREATLGKPRGLAVDNDGSLYIADTENHRIRKIDSKGIITTIAGNGIAGFSGDGGPASLASLNRPTGISVDEDGTLLVTDIRNQRVRKIFKVTDENGKVTYNISSLLANSETDCGVGMTEKTVRDSEVKAAFSETMAAQCLSHPRAIASTGSCAQSDGKMTVAIYQNFGLEESFTGTLSANVLRFVQPCQP